MRKAAMRSDGLNDSAGRNGEEAGFNDILHVMKSERHLTCFCVVVILEFRFTSYDLSYMHSLR